MSRPQPHTVSFQSKIIPYSVTRIIRSVPGSVFLLRCPPSHHPCLSLGGAENKLHLLYKKREEETKEALAVQYRDGITERWTFFY